MSFYRKCKIKVTFDMFRVRDEKGNPVNIYLGPFEKEIEYEEDPKYKSRREAYEVDGTLEEWADKVGKAIALDLAAKWVGAEVPEDLDTTTVRGNTFEARNIKGEPSNLEEGTTCPEDVAMRIEDLQVTIKEAEEKIEKYEDEIRKLEEKREEAVDVFDRSKDRYSEFIESEKGYIKSYKAEIERLIRKYCEED